MLKKTTKIYLTAIILMTLIGLSGAIFVQAGLLDKQTGVLRDIGFSAGYDTTGANDASTLAQKVGAVIGVMLSILGVVFLCLVVYSGYQWMTAGGEEEKITKARNRMVQAAIGLAIISLSYAITTIIIKNPILNRPVNTTTQSSSQIDDKPCSGPGLSCLPFVECGNKGGIESDYGTQDCVDNHRDMKIPICCKIGK